MTPSSRHHSRLELACEPSASRYARAHARDVLWQWGLSRNVLNDALTIISELVTNAARYAGAPTSPREPHESRPEARLCVLSLLLVPDWLYISVYDEAPHKPPVLRQVPADDESGRGIALVNGLTEGQWGWEPSAGKPGKFVWARLKLVPSDAQDSLRQPRPSGMSA
jgi:serine/threonine-protein kinase RsbW